MAFGPALPSRDLPFPYYWGKGPGDGGQRWPPHPCQQPHASVPRSTLPVVLGRSAAQSSETSTSRGIERRRPASEAAVAVGDRQAAVASEGARRDLHARRRLPPLVLAAV